MHIHQTEHKASTVLYSVALLLVYTTALLFSTKNLPPSHIHSDLFLSKYYYKLHVITKYWQNSHHVLSSYTRRRSDDMPPVYTFYNIYVRTQGAPPHTPYTCVGGFSALRSFIPLLCSVLCFIRSRECEEHIVFVYMAEM